MNSRNSERGNTDGVGGEKVKFKEDMEATEPAVKVKRDVSEGEKWKNAK